MPDRIVRAGIITSDRVNELSWASEVFYRRLMSVADDYGRFDARPSILRAELYALKLDRVSEPDVVKWLGECSKAGLIRMYTVNNKAYLEILEFNQRLRAMKSKYPAPPLEQKPQLLAPVENCGQMTADDRGCLTDDGLKRNESETESETEKKHTPNGDSEAGASPTDSPPDYKDLKKDKKSIADYIKAHKPDFIDPYVDLWNLFAKEKGLAQVTKVSDKRKRKFKVRVKETAFDFMAILKKAGQSEFLLTGKWFCFDWIMDNESNYLKVIEGNYDKKPESEKKPGNQAREGKPADKTFGETISYLFARYQEGQLDERLILPEYYDLLVVRNVIPRGSSENQSGPSIDDKKRQAILQLFKQKSNEAKAVGAITT